MLNIKPGFLQKVSLRYDNSFLIILLVHFLI